jgi:putative redox protein
MEMYAQRKGLGHRGRRGRGAVPPRRPRLPDPLRAHHALPDTLATEQVERLKVIAAKCPVHRTLDGEVMFDERVERVSLAR